MNAEDLHAGAAVGGAFEAGRRGGIVDVGFERALVAGLHVRDAFTGRQHLESEFVTGDARIGKERHLAEIAGEIGPADAHAVGADQRLAGAGRGRFGEIDDVDLFGAGELDGFHGEVERQKCQVI